MVMYGTTMFLIQALDTYRRHPALWASVFCIPGQAALAAGMSTSGALLRVTLDLEHWLSAGTDGQVQAMVEGQRVFTPLRLDKGGNVGTFAAQDVVASGLVWFLSPKPKSTTGRMDVVPVAGPGIAGVRLQETF